jgi:thymidylate kinase
VLVDPAEARRRGGEYRDRIERETEEFMRRADEAFRSLAVSYPDRIVALDGHQPAEEIGKEVREHVRALL